VQNTYCQCEYRILASIHPPNSKKKVEKNKGKAKRNFSRGGMHIAFVWGGGEEGGKFNSTKANYTNIIVKHIF